VLGFAIYQNFNPRPRAGSDLFSDSSQQEHHTFQSTPPSGERPPYFSEDMPTTEISIHAPERGATIDSLDAFEYSWISIHAPERGATFQRHDPLTSDLISIHAPERGATSTIGTCNQILSKFQSTPPSGERLPVIDYLEPVTIISIHAPERGATNGYAGVNTHFCISIHAPERGATFFLRASIAYVIISIHAPERGATN